MTTLRTQILFIIVLLTVFFGIITVAANLAHADSVIQNCAVDSRYCTTEFVPLESFGGSRKLADAYNTPELGPFIQKVFVGAISLGAILAVLRLAWAGFTYMASDLPGVKSSAKEIISDTFLGLFLLLGIWLILYQINPDILKLKINITNPTSQSSGSTGNTVYGSPQDENMGNFGDVPPDVQGTVTGIGEQNTFPAEATDVPPAQPASKAWYCLGGRIC